VLDNRLGKHCFCFKWGSIAAAAIAKVPRRRGGRGGAVGIQRRREPVHLAVHPVVVLVVEEVVPPVAEHAELLVVEVHLFGALKEDDKRDKDDAKDDAAEGAGDNDGVFAGGGRV
jgi:hypothetical protein